jgi:hypothetical protein
MYAKTNLGSGHMSPRQKRVLGVIVGLIVALIAGLVIWGALRPDSLASSGHGCVNVNLAGSMGGENFHYCGEQAKSFCQTSFRTQDPLSLAARPQCVLAGLAPAATATASASLQVDDDGDRAVVDQRDLHLGAEHAGLHPGAGLAQRPDQGLDNGLGDRARRRG